MGVEALSLGRGIIKLKSGSRGFGAIELALVLVVLGIVFTFTLKGAALIPKMRAFVIGQQINQYKSAVQHYQDVYRNMPGDDPAAPGRWNRPPSLFVMSGRAFSLAGDSKIDGLLDDAGNASGEQYMAWSDLRNAGLAEGDPTLVGISARPENFYGGAFGFAAENLGLQQVLCLTRVPGADAETLDNQFDDGKVATGEMRGTSQWDPTEKKNNFPEPDKDPYNPEKTYIICVPNAS